MSSQMKNKLVRKKEYCDVFWSFERNIDLTSLEGNYYSITTVHYEGF